MFLFTVRKRTKWLLDLFTSINQLARVQVMKVYFLYHTLMGAHEKPRYTCSRRYMKRCLSRDPHVVRKDIFCLHVCLRRFSSLYNSLSFIHRIHKWRTRGKKLVPSHESEALEDKQKLQMKTFSELAKCLARIPPKITFYGLLYKYNYVGCLLL